MTDDGFITNRILLDHIQGNSAAIDRLSKRVDQLEEKMEEGFEEARLDRQNLHEDLEATIMEQFQHKKQLAAIAGAPAPEDYE